MARGPPELPSATRLEQVVRYAFGQQGTPHKVESALGTLFEQYEGIDGQAEATTGRTGQRRSDSKEDPHRAFITDCSIQTTDSGPLAGTTVGIKDNIAVGGIEMTCGSPLLAGYVPDDDATVVGRLLDAGGHVTAKTAMRPLAIGTEGARVTPGPVLNPHDRTHVAGGSSGGSAAAVAAGDVDIALGTDQGGSVRNPASYCGCVGLKPTHGLVPYTGSAGLGPTIDHIGPITRTVEDCARTLSVLAGPDGADPRQGTVRVDDYVSALEADLSGLTVGILAEGFERDSGDPRVDDAVRSALQEFAELGCGLTTVSVPEHDRGRNVWTAIANEEIATVFHGGGVGHLGPGRYEPGFVSVLTSAVRAQPEALPPVLVARVLAGLYLLAEYGSYYYASAHCRRRELRAAYDAALEAVDVLAMPTTPTTAPKSPADNDGVEPPPLADRLSLRGNKNRATFNASGHPALTVPCGTVDGLPVGMTLVGAHFDERTLLAVAAAFERAVGW